MQFFRHLHINACVFRLRTKAFFLHHGEPRSQRGEFFIDYLHDFWLDSVNTSSVTCGDSFCSPQTADPSVIFDDISPNRGVSSRRSLPSGNPFLGIRILRFAQNDINLSLRAFAEGAAIRFSLRNGQDRSLP